MTIREKELAGLCLQAATRLRAPARRSSSTSSSRSSARPLRTPNRPPGSTPTPRSASAARRARSRASSGTSFPRTGSSGPATATTTPGELSATSWRHVKFIEQLAARRAPMLPGRFRGFDPGRWLMMSDVCKHCVTAPCQQACPTGALIHNEFGNVYIQPDICNGCAYCIAACPFGVITRSTIDGHAHKCTLCYDRQRDGLVPACAKACPTESIQFGPIDELRERARKRVEELARARSLWCVPVRRRAGSDLLRAEFVLPAGRSSVGVRASGDARQPVARA